VADVLIGRSARRRSFGAFAATSRAVADLFGIARRPLVFSTGLPPSVPASARAATDRARPDGDARRRARANHARSFGARGRRGRRERESDRARARATTARSWSAPRGCSRAASRAGHRPPTVPVGTARLA